MTTAQAAELVNRLVSRAALDGSTAIRASVLATVLRGYGVADPALAVELAESNGDVVTFAGEDLVAVPEVARAEHRVAAEVSRLLAGETLLTLGLGVASEDRPGGTLVTDAHRLELPEAAELLRAAEPGHPLTLVGDPDALQPAGPGRPFGDLVASGLVPVAVQASRASERPHLAQLLAALRSGQLPPIPTDQREVVLVPAQDGAQVRGRVLQLLTGSLPRSLSVPSSDTLLLTVRTQGALGVEALLSAVTAAGIDVAVATVAAAVGRRVRAIVLVLPAEAAGSLSRALLISALSMADEHVSIVHQAGPALAVAVAQRPHRPRLTRLPALLRSMC